MDMEIKRLKRFYREHETGFKRISFFLKLLCSAILIYFIFTKISFKETFHYISSLSGTVIFLIIITTLIKFYLQMWNWEILLGIDPKVNYTKSSIFKTHVLGLLFKLIVPGGQGSFGKIIYLKQLTKKSAFFIILLEKLFQSWIFFTAGALSAFFYFKSLKVIYLLIFIISFIIPSILPIIIKSATSEYKWKRYKKRLLPLVLSQFVYLLLTFYQYYLILEIFSDISFINTMISISLVLASTLLPISYSGLGIRESVSVLVLRGYHISPEIAVACSLMIFIFNSVIPALPGLFFLFRKVKN